MFGNDFVEISVPTGSETTIKILYTVSLRTLRLVRAIVDVNCANVLFLANYFAAFVLCVKQHVTTSYTLFEWYQVVHALKHAGLQGTYCQYFGQKCNNISATVTDHSTYLVHARWSSRHSHSTKFVFSKCAFSFFISISSNFSHAYFDIVNQSRHLT